MTGENIETVSLFRCWDVCFSEIGGQIDELKRRLCEGLETFGTKKIFKDRSGFEVLMSEVYKKLLYQQ